MCREGRHAVGGQSAGCQGVVGVHGCAVLVVSMSSDGRVEAGPEHPQVDGTYGSTTDRMALDCFIATNEVKAALGNSIDDSSK